MNLKEQLDTEIAEYNVFAQQTREAKERAEALEQERLMRLGGVQKLAELVQKEQARELSIAAGQNGNRVDADEEAVEEVIKSAEN